jgi:hypothetical protein
MHAVHMVIITPAHGYVPAAAREVGHRPCMELMWCAGVESNHGLHCAPNFTTSRAHCVNPPQLCVLSESSIDVVNRRSGINLTELLAAKGALVLHPPHEHLL